MDEGGKSVPAVLSAWSRRVLDSAMDAVVVIDDRGRVVYWNPAAVAMFGHTWEQVAGRDMANLIIPPQLRPAHREAFGRSGLGGPRSVLGRRIEVVGQHVDGTLFPVELTITRTDEGGARMFTGYLRDISERRQLLKELHASRTRLLQVSDAVRREIERDLHDGAQQQLVGAAMVVAQARATLPGGPHAAADLLDRAGEVLVAAITELRELARGVLPRVLTDHGLKPALSELGRRSPIPVHIEAVPDRWPSMVELSLYFFAAEGLTNAAKHGAQSVTVQLGLEPVQVGMAVDDSAAAGMMQAVCSIVDDGPGGADADHGTGLRGLEDRVTAAGGTLRIMSPAGRGTTLVARIPVTERAE
jgi:PAS domain S-box-containing protein